MTDWALYVADTGGDAIGELAGATGRTVTFKLDGPPEASWSVNGLHPDAAVLDELTTDIYVRWGGRTVERLRTGASQDTIGADGHTCSFGAVGYRGLLERRATFQALTYTGVDIADIAWDLVDYTQNRVGLAGGPVGISQGRSPSIADVNHVVPEDKQIAEAINDLAGLGFGRGFDWEISSDLEFNVWERRGTDRDFVAEYGSNVVAVTRSVDTAEYANAVRSSGADGVASSTAAAVDLASRPEGRMEAHLSNTDLTTTATVTATAASELVRHGNIVPSYVMTMAPGAWSPDLLWLGDSATFVVQSGRLNVVGRDRVVEVAVSIGDDGGETVELTFGTRRLDMITLFRRSAARLESLSRR